MVVKKSEVQDLSYIRSIRKIANDEGIKGLFAGTSPRIGKAILSGAIQFAAYEETKTKIASIFQQKQEIN
jgi:solute carrier family 25 S-adenosylmethionine transporter 26